MDHRKLAMAGLLLVLLLGAAAGGAEQQAAANCSNAQPPTGSLQVLGPQIRVGERLFVATAARIEVTALDAARNPARWKPVVSGREEATWPASWSAGEHSVSAVLLDGCGNRGETAPLTFQVDAEPPAIRWQVGDRRAFADRLAPDSEPRRRRRRGAVGEGRPAGDSWESAAGVLRIPLPWTPGLEDRETSPSRARFPVAIASDHPQVFLDAPGTTAAVDGSTDSLDGRVLWIAADDSGAGVDRLTLRLRAGEGRAVLEVEATDLVGNASRKEIVLRSNTRDLQSRTIGGNR